MTALAEARASRPATGGAGAARGRVRARVRADLAAQPRPRGAPAAREAVLGRGIRDLEQLVVRRPPRRSVQRAVPAARRGAHAAGRCGDRRRRNRGAVRAARPPALRRGRVARVAVVRGRRRDQPVHRAADVRVRAAAGGRRRARAAAPPPVARGAARAADRAVQPGGGAVRRDGRRGARDRLVPRAASGAARRSPGLGLVVASLAPVARARDRVPGGRARAVRVLGVVADARDRGRRADRGQPRRADPDRRDRALRGGLHRRLRGADGGRPQRRRGSASWSPDRSRRCCCGRGARRCCWRSRCRCCTSSGTRRCATSPTHGGTSPQAAAYYRPLLSFLSRQPGPRSGSRSRSRAFHWEAFEVAPHFPIARGWERQLDITYNHLFYGGRLTPATYEAWLHELAVRFVAVPHAPFDYSAVKEVALIDRGLPYLRLVMHTRTGASTRCWARPRSSQGPARLRAIGANSLTLDATRPGSSYVRVRFTPYWAITEGSGCVGAG